ncbi:MAG TPA: DUF5009 domain-containing protein [Acidobacteriota bacterium]|nr:DUF5009 domain-containing protein [Acidobacteriota bacterium]HRV07188.1 DUF5009 domain-containing protein [Acidobacteriota bacterium]
MKKDLSVPVPGRVISLDAFRGLTMFLLVAEGAGLYEALQRPEFSGTILGWLAVQFSHHPWNGLRFWDLVQPFFMFIVGVAMPFSLGKRRERGDSEGKILAHVLYRSFVLFWLGVILHCGYNGKLVFELWNVLTQLSFTYLVAYLLMRYRPSTQIGASAALLLITEALYRLWSVPGFDQPFVKDHNFGSYVDMLLMGKLNPGGGWVAFNCVPTACHTIWGVLAGQVLRNRHEAMTKVKKLLLPGLILIVAGYAMDPITPIIKRIATSSFTVVTGGWCLVVLAAMYWLVDMKGYRRWCWFGVIVGMNSIFIYLFNNTVGPQWMNGFLRIFTEGFLGGLGPATVDLTNAAVSLAVSWYLCYWLYKHKILFKI